MQIRVVAAALIGLWSTSCSGSSPTPNSGATVQSPSTADAAAEKAPTPSGVPAEEEAVAASPEAAPQIAIGTPDAPPVEAPKPRTLEEAAPEAPPHVLKAIRDMRVRQNCNLVMGCEPLDVLVAARELSVGAIAVEIDRSSPDLSHVPFLLDALGEIGLRARKAIPTIQKALDEGPWLTKGHAAQALGRLGDRSTLPQLEKLVLDPEVDPFTRSSAAYAMFKLGVKDHSGLIEIFLTEDAVKKQNWGYTAGIVPLAAELELTDALPGIRLATRHRDYFLRKAATKALAELNDHTSVDRLTKLLDDKMPGVRKAALASLESLAEKRFLTPAEARAWATANSAQ